MKTSKINEIMLEIYRALYKEATPSADIDELIASGESKKEGFFNNYYLEDSRQEEIIRDILKTKKVSKNYKDLIYRSIILGAAPTGFKKDE
jgi:hypothetical protein